MKNNGIIKFFDIPSYLTLPDNEAPINNGSIIASNENTILPGQNNISGFSKGWNGFQYQVPRYSPIPEDCNVTISAFNIQKYLLNVDGGINTKTTGTITSVTTVNSTAYNDHLNAVVDYANDKADSAIDNLIEKNESNAISFGRKVLSAALSITKKDIPTILKEGFNLIFGRTTVRTYNTESDVHVSTNGNIELQGYITSETPTNIGALSFNLHDIIRKNSIINVVDTLRIPRNIVWRPAIPDTLKPNWRKFELDGLGVWTIKSKPKFYWELMKRVENITGQNQPGMTFETGGVVPYPEIVKHAVEIEFNPYIKPYIKSYKITVLPMANEEYDIEEPLHFSPRLKHSDLIFGDGDKCFLEFPKGTCNIRMVTDIQDEVDPNGRFYFRWSLPGYQTFAHITMEMKIEYLGKSFTVTESRVYRAKNVVSTEGLNNATWLHSPPSNIILNYEGTGWLMSQY